MHRSEGLHVATVVTAHGFGHLTRQLALAAALVDRGARVSVWTGQPALARAEAATWPASARGRFDVVSWRADVGLVQPDSLTHDYAATASAIAEVCAPARIRALGEALVTHRFGAPALVIADAPPTALHAARLQGLDAVAMTNFEWPWTYEHYPALRAEAAALAALQRDHAVIPLTPASPMRHFAAVEPAAGVLARVRPPRPLPPRSVLVAFGGIGLSGLDAVLPRVPGLTWVLTDPLPRLSRPDVHFAEAADYPGLVAGADVVLTKPGYGIVAETALAGARVVWVDRGPFPEAEALEGWLRQRGDRKAAALAPEAIAAAVQRRLADPRPAAVASGAAALAARVLDRIGGR